MTYGGMSSFFFGGRMEILTRGVNKDPRSTFRFFRFSAPSALSRLNLREVASSLRCETQRLLG